MEEKGREGRAKKRKQKGEKFLLLAWISWSKISHKSPNAGHRYSSLQAAKVSADYVLNTRGDRRRNYRLNKRRVYSLQATSRGDDCLV